MILCFPQWHIFQKWGVFQQSKGWDHGKFSRGKPPDARFFNRFARVSFQPPNVNFVPTVIESSFKPLPNVLSIFCSSSVFRMALLFFCFFAQIFGQSMHLRCSYVSRDHDHLSYGGGGSNLQIFTLANTDPALLFCRKSLRCATNNSTKNLGCASAILSILAGCRLSAFCTRVVQKV